MLIIIIGNCEHFVCGWHINIKKNKLQKPHCQNLSPTTAIPSADGYEFLDLSDIEDVDRCRVSSALQNEHESQQQHDVDDDRLHDKLPQLDSDVVQDLQLLSQRRMQRKIVLPKIILVPLHHNDTTQFIKQQHHQPHRCLPSDEECCKNAPQQSSAPKNVLTLVVSPVVRPGGDQFNLIPSYSRPDLPHGKRKPCACVGVLGCVCVCVFACVLCFCCA